MTQADRSYRVLAYGLMEERRVRRDGGEDQMPQEEFDRRHREIWESCYGKKVETGSR